MIDTSDESIHAEKGLGFEWNIQKFFWILASTRCGNKLMHFLVPMFKFKTFLLNKFISLGLTYGKISRDLSVV